MHPLHIRVLAKEDIQEIVTYYDLKASSITDRFLERLFVEFNVIAETPELFQEKYRQTRVRYIKGFPYGIHYTFKEESVEVLAVLHTSRNPNFWKKR